MGTLIISLITVNGGDIVFTRPIFMIIYKRVLTYTNHFNVIVPSLLLLLHYNVRIIGFNHHKQNIIIILDNKYEYVRVYLSL